MKKLFLIISFVLIASYLFCQFPTATAVNFISDNSDARSVGIAGIGVVSASDFYNTGLSQNPALLSKYDSLRNLNLSMDINSEAFTKFGLIYPINKKLSIGLLYNKSKMFYKSKEGDDFEYPYPWKKFNTELKLAYSFNSKFSAGVGFKYIYGGYIYVYPDNYVLNTIPTANPIRAFAGDIGFDYRNEIKKNENSYWRYDIGTSIINIGTPTISEIYSGERELYLPITLKLGSMLSYVKEYGSKNTYNLNIAGQVEKLLVPTAYDDRYSSTNHDLPIFEGMLLSLHDSPKGFEGEMEEITQMLGVENKFIFNDKSSFSIRTGYWKRKFPSLLMGLGGSYRSFYLDIAIPVLQHHKRGTDLKPCLSIGYKYTIK